MAPDPSIFLWIAAPVADAATFNLNYIKTLFFLKSIKDNIKGNPVFSNGSKVLPENLP